MNKPEIASYKETVENLHHCVARYRGPIQVIEDFEDQRAWEGEVHVFALEGHPSAQKAYAWSVAVPGSKRRRFYAVLHEGPVDSPEKAVRAAIVQAHRENTEE